MNNRFDALPDDIKSLIYSFDPTARERMKPVIQEIDHNTHVSELINKKLYQMWLLYGVGNPPCFKSWCRKVKAMARYRTKRQLLTACRLLGCDRPSRPMTKNELVMWIFYDVFYGPVIRDGMIGFL